MFDYLPLRLLKFFRFRTYIYIFIFYFFLVGNCAWHQDRKQLLQQWVNSGGNAQSIEADLVLSKTRANKHQSKRELLTTSEMQRREIPIEKIRAIVARGNGVADPDCPHIPSLTRFWVSTSTTEIDTDEVKQEATLRLQADAASTIGLMGANQSSTASSALGADGMQQILQSLQTPAVEDTGLHPDFLLFMLVKHFHFGLHACPFKWTIYMYIYIYVYNIFIYTHV